MHSMSTLRIPSAASKQIITARTSTKVNATDFLPTYTAMHSSRFQQDVRQCVIYDSPEPNARLIGVEYLISATLYKTLEPSERKLWHSHVFEVKSGMLIMPGPEGLPTGIWEEAETREMEDVVGLYGKTYHFWQIDRGDKLPLGSPELMMSFKDEEQCPGFGKIIEERDNRFGISSKQKREKRDYIPKPEVHAGTLIHRVYNWTCC